MLFVVAKVVRRCGCCCGDVVLGDDVFVVERFDEMLLRRWRGDVVVGAVVGMAWLLRCGCSKIKIAKE